MCHQVVVTPEIEMDDLECQELFNENYCDLECHEVVLPPENGMNILDEPPLKNQMEMWSPYLTDIYEYLREREEEKLRQDRMEIEQTRLENKETLRFTKTKRHATLCWLVRVADKFQCVPETLYLAALIHDRYLMRKSIDDNKMDLLGASALWVASKYEESNTRPLTEFSQETRHHVHAKEEIQAMESDILKCIKFDLGFPTVLTFSRLFIRQVTPQDRVDLPLEYMTSYLAELCLLCWDLTLVSPSNIAAAVVFYARFILRPHIHPWTLSLQTYTRYKASELERCVRVIIDLVRSTQQRTGVEFIRNKYKELKFQRVSEILPATPREIPPSYFGEAIKAE